MMGDGGRTCFKGLLQCTDFISINKRLDPGGKRGKHLSAACVREMKELEDSLERIGIVKGCLNSDKRLYGISYVFYLKANVLRRDIDNLVKTPTDVITRYLGINDSRIISYKICKRMLVEYPPNVPRKEYLVFELERMPRTPEELKVSFKDFTERYQKST